MWSAPYDSRSSRHMKNSESTAWIEQHFEVHEGFPRPDWAAIAKQIEDNFDEPQRNQTWLTVVDEWLSKIIEALGEGYWLGESENFLVVASESEQYINSLARFLENTLDRVLTTLDGIASDEGYGKHVVMIFRTLDQYYSYISYFYPEEGEFATSGGIYVNRGYGHFALPHAGGGGG